MMKPLFENTRTTTDDKLVITLKCYIELDHFEDQKDLIDPELYESMLTRIYNDDYSVWFEARLSVAPINAPELAIETIRNQCSYESFGDFIDSEDYDDMLEDCLTELKNRRKSWIDALTDIEDSLAV